MPMSIHTHLLLLLSVRYILTSDSMQETGEHLPFWLQHRMSESSATGDCLYTCSAGGGCKVQYRGYSLGFCDQDGLCSGTPSNCMDCNSAISCNDGAGYGYGAANSAPDDSKAVSESKTHFGAANSAPDDSEAVSKSQTNFDLLYKQVTKDLKIMMTKSKEFWPADYGHYGPFFVRLAWHSSGSYRLSDGRGGADGGRMRFDPERSWGDNTNLDKARTLLWPIKQKYGLVLSWGDLFVLAGNAAIESMGGPKVGFCGGRVDDDDGTESLPLGPSMEQEMLMPCKVQGECEAPLGSHAVGAMYVNPEGHMGNPNPRKSANDIREVFSRMNMNDIETVALIGGGHTWGKAHGACPAGAGPSPKEDQINPWPGMCGTGKGKDTAASGFEMPFTSRPLHWDNEYFKNLLDFEWHVEKGPGNKYQWKPHMKNGTYPPTAPQAHRSGRQVIGLLTSDVALIHDDTYRKIVTHFAEDEGAFTTAFKDAWYKLTTRDMGPVTRCRNSDHPPAQWWQKPLPEPPAQLADFDDVKLEINKVLSDDYEQNIGKLTRLAWQCSNTFRSTDYTGGCNGARIRFPQQKYWEVNKNLENALKLLEPIKDQFGKNLSWADLIILAGNTALEKAGGKTLKFCGGRTDARSAYALPIEAIPPKITGNFHESLPHLKDYIAIMGLSQREFTALLGAGYAVGDPIDCAGLFCQRNSFLGTKSSSSYLSNIFFTTLLSENWEEYTVPRAGTKMYKAIGKDLLMFGTDLWFKFDAELLAIAQDFASDNEMFLTELAAAWTKLSNADRFKGPTGNVCHE